jgi:trigger factor
VKSALETLSPTRVRLTVEVPFGELKPSLDSAYRKLARQVRVQGFRPGKVPPRILDQRLGRGVILEEAVQDAVPRFYSEAIRSNKVRVLGQPEVEVTRFADGDELAFTAEVDVRPDIELPEYHGLPITVDDADVTPDKVDQQLGSLRDRFAVLQSADRPVQLGDYVSIDLRAEVDGEEIPAASATGLSHEVGSDQLMPGLDDALVGLSEGDTATFDSELLRGEHAGRTAQVTVTVNSVKVKELPALDDEFAQTASEFDTLAELREDTRARLERVERLQQGVQARDRVIETLLERTSVPLPDGVVDAEVKWRTARMREQVEQAGLSWEDYLEGSESSPDQFEAEMRESSRRDLTNQFVLDAIAGKEQLQVSEAELTEQIVRRAQRAGVAPEQYAQQIVQSESLPALMGELLRAKALALVMESATVTDSSGRPVDLNALQTATPTAELEPEEVTVDAG